MDVVENSAIADAFAVAETATAAKLMPPNLYLRCSNLADLNRGMHHAPISVMSTDHRKLSAFQIADQFVVKVYDATRDFAADERYGLRSQIRRAAVSVPTNIVEGCARDSDREHARYFEIAFGSAREAIYLIDLASRLKFLDRKAASELADFGGRVAAALAALRKTLS